jgi:hypothetical protein
MHDFTGMYDFTGALNHVFPIGYENVEHWKGKHIKLMEVVYKMTGSYRIHDAIRAYAIDKSKGVSTGDREFTSGNKSYRLNASGALYKDGIKVLQVLDRNLASTSCLRLAGTAYDSYSFTNEIPVKLLEGPGMHAINYEFWTEMIEQAFCAPRRGKWEPDHVFRAAIGIRYWAYSYATHFGLDPLPITNVELAELSKMALLEGDSGDLSRIRSYYHSLYQMSDGQSIQDIGRQTDLNAISSSHA